MPANGRQDLIRRLKVNIEYNISVVTVHNEEHDVSYKCVIQIHILLLKHLACHTVIFIYSTCKMPPSSESCVTIQTCMQAVNCTAANQHTPAVFVTATANQHTSAVFVTATAYQHTSAIFVCHSNSQSIHYILT